MGNGYLGRSQRSTQPNAPAQRALELAPRSVKVELGILGEPRVVLERRLLQVLVEAMRVEAVRAEAHVRAAPRVNHVR